MHTESALRKHYCCFTGHRPEKLAMTEGQIKTALDDHIRAAIGDGYQTFISGMARGVDIWAAETVLQLQNDGQPIHLICASPYEGFETRWSSHWQERYRRILARADLIKLQMQKENPRLFSTKPLFALEINSLSHHFPLRI